MGRSPSSKNNNNELMKKGPWTPEEDEKLVDYIQKHGQGSWQLLPKRAGINRCGKSCRLRWTNYLRPDIRRGNFSPEEEHTIIQLHSILGNKWSTIATHLPGRTDNEIKNLWNTHLRKKLLQSGIDPQTHQSIINTIDHDHINPLNLLLMNLPPLSMLPLPTPSFNNHIIRPPLENLAAKIRLLHDILLVLKTNIAPNNFLEESLHECFYKSEGFNTGIVNISSMVPNLEDISYNQDSNSFQPIGVTIPEFVNVQNKGIVSSNNNNNNNNNNTISDFSLPALLSSENQGDQNVDYYGVLSNNNQVLVDCNDVDTCWGTILKGDEASTSSFWKDIFIE